MLSSSTKDLPVEIVIDILSRLPVKALLRSTSVCKSWYFLIKSPNFITTHLNFSISHKTNCNPVIMPREMDMFGGIYYFSNSSFDEHYDRLVYRYVDIDTQYMSKNLVGSCNGLLCLAYYPYPFVDIVNPSIRRGKSLPSSVIFPKFDAMSFSVHELVVGFGYVQQNNDYKVVRIYYFRNDLGVAVLPAEVEVYSLCVDSWRRIDAAVDFFAVRDSVAFVSGAVHWMAKEYNGFGTLRDSNVGNEYKYIISFNIVDESFQKIKLPENCLDGYHVYPFLMNYKESLSLVVYFAYAENAVERFHTVWVMSEYGVTDSWTKHFTFLLSASGSVQKPLGYMNSDKFIFQKDDRELVSFDLNSLDLKSLQLQGLQIDDGPYVVDANYKGNLVLLEERDVDLVVEN